MSKIDWTKPIETLEGHPATLLTVMSCPDDPYVIVTTNADGIQHLHRCNEVGHHIFTNVGFFRNVAPPLKLYGRLEPRWGGDIEEMAWTILKSKSDTHVMEIPANRLNEFIKPL